jgi:hypothetical protein
MTLSGSIQLAAPLPAGSWAVASSAQQDNPLAQYYVVGRLADNDWQPLGLVSPSVERMVTDSAGRIYVVGGISHVISGDGTRVEAAKVAVWDPALAEGGGWAAMGEVDGPFPPWTLTVGAHDRFYIGGHFATARNGDGSVVTLNGVGWWDAAAQRWRALGGGVAFPEMPTGREVRSLAEDQQGRILVGGTFTHVVQSDGALLEVGGIARWDPATNLWETLGDGFVIDTDFTGTVLGIVIEDDGDVLASGRITLPGSPTRTPVARYDGTAWTSYSEGLQTGISALEMKRDSAGTLLLIYYSGGLRMTHRKLGDPAWSSPGITGAATFVADPARPGFFLGGSRIRIGSRYYGSAAHWTPTDARPILLPGGCSTVQPLHVAADPRLAGLDLYVNSALERDDFAYQTGAAPLTFSPVANPWIALGPGSDNSSTAASNAPIQISGMSIADRQCVTALVGVFDPEAFAPNPTGRPTTLRLVQADVTGGLEQAGRSVGVDQAQTPVLVLHAVTDAPALDVQVRETGQVLAQSLLFGQFAPLAAVDPGGITLELRRSSDGSLFKTASLDLSGREGVVTLALSGFADPAANQDGPGMSVFAVDATGESGVWPVSTEVPPSEGHPRSELLGNHPNPFSQTTSLSYSVARPGRVVLEVFDVSGRRRAVLVDEDQAEGTYTLRVEALDLPAGIYLTRLRTGGATSTRPIALLR